jgi:hypothetical protein
MVETQEVARAGGAVSPVAPQPAGGLWRVREERPDITARAKGLKDSFADALNERRFFILLPFAVIGGWLPM